MKWKAILTIAASASLASTSHAQQCIGALPRGVGALRVGGLLIRSSAGSGFGGRAGTAVALPSARSTFLEVTGTRVMPADEPELAGRGVSTNPAYEVSGDVGVELPFTRRGAVSLCPTVGVAYTSGPELLVPDPPVSAGDPGGELEIESATLAWAAGAWLGGTLGRRGVRLMPAVGAHVVHDRTTTTAEGREQGASIDTSDGRSATWVRLSLAAGLGIGDRLFLLPRVTLPVATPGPRGAVVTLMLGSSIAW